MAPQPQVGTDSFPARGRFFVSLFSFWILCKPCCWLYNCLLCPPPGDSTMTKDSAILPTYLTVDLANEDPQKDPWDPWDLPELNDTGVKWSGEAALVSQHSVDDFLRLDSEPVACFCVVLFLFFFDRAGHKRKDKTGADWHFEDRCAPRPSLHVYLLPGYSQFCFPACRRWI